MAKRPLIAVSERQFLGETRDHDFGRLDHLQTDRTFVPGYSDRRVERDEALAGGKRATALPFRLQWVGKADAVWRLQGYRPLKVDELEGFGLGFPPAAQQTPEGLIQAGDVWLWICDAERAARNEEHWHRAMEETRDTGAIPSQLERMGREVARPGEVLTFAESTFVSDDRKDPPLGG